jgi:hypothetical protein
VRRNDDHPSVFRVVSSILFSHASPLHSFQSFWTIYQCSNAFCATIISSRGIGSIVKESAISLLISPRQIIHLSPSLCFVSALEALAARKF